MTDLTSTRPLRVTVVMTHPIQYFSPWFRWITECAPELALTVLYAAVPNAEQQGRGYGTAFQWDVPVLDGYRYEVCERPEGKAFTDDAFWGAGVGEMIARTRPDVALVAGWHSAFQVRALLACRRRRIPTIYRGDSTLAMAPRGWRRGVWSVRTWLLLRLFRGWLSVGTQAHEYLRHFGIPEEKMASSPHSVDHAWFAERAAVGRKAGAGLAWRHAHGIPVDDFVVLFVGRLLEKKRPLDAVRAVARLSVPATLVLAGAGPARDEAVQEGKTLGVRIVAPGFVNQQELAVLYGGADVLLLPSMRETWGLVVNEALASGLPCVVSESVAAGIDLIQDGVNGWRVPVGDVGAIARALSSIQVGRAGGRFGVADCEATVLHRGFGEATAGLVSMCRMLSKAETRSMQSVVS